MAQMPPLDPEPWEASVYPVAPEPQPFTDPQTTTGWSDQLTTPYGSPSRPPYAPGPIAAPPPPPRWAARPLTEAARSSSPGLPQGLLLLGMGALIGLALVAVLVTLALVTGRFSAGTLPGKRSVPAAPTHSPTMQPTNTPAPLLTVAITCLTTQGNDQANLCIHTFPDTTLAITTVDCDGVPDPQAPTAGTADGAGQYRATWQPRQPRKHCATATVTVAASWQGQQATTSGTLALNQTGD